MLLGFAVSIGALLDKHSNRHSLLVLSDIISGSGRTTGDQSSLCDNVIYKETAAN
uniref:Uncharacterized protein n=1 Tax=Helianthus annuus TaxID=4232 RepID=A0A251V4T7_HELAN